ncbi:hypothetical protein HG530_014817 [Fusarium avenaceum]|nr:hypothetical protein HG530_014817 [Fusarium avenaceum]
MDQVLVEVSLSNVAAVDIVAKSLVLEQSSVRMSQEMDMGCTASVMTWEEGLKLRNTIVIGWLDTTAKGVVDVGLVVDVSVTLVVHTANLARGVGGIAEIGLVVVGVENFLKIALLDTT